MKKILICLLFVFCLFSCSGLIDYKYKAKVTYEIIYPDTVIRYDTIFNCCTTGAHIDEDVQVGTSSYKGTNYIFIIPGGYYNQKVRTTCPIRIISYDKTKYDIE